jgi:hypothetical protein
MTFEKEFEACSKVFENILFFYMEISKINLIETQQTYDSTTIPFSYT